MVASVMVGPGSASATGGAKSSTLSHIPCPRNWGPGPFWPNCRPPCPKRWQGTFWPKCHPPCPKGWTGEFWPNCKPPKCPPGMVPPYCEKPPKHHMRKGLMATRPPGL
jgi:hypothetical protein